MLSLKARYSSAEKEVRRLTAARAALRGESAPEAQSDEQRASTPSGEGSSPSRRAKRKKNKDDHPLAHIRCAGCGQSGTMSETIVQAPSGTHVRMLVCHDCGNQSMLG